MQTPERGETTSETSEGAFNPTQPPKSPANCFLYVLFSSSTVRDPPTALAPAPLDNQPGKSKHNPQDHPGPPVSWGGLNDTHPPTLTSSRHKQPVSYTCSRARHSAETSREQPPSTPSAGAPWREGGCLGLSRAVLTLQTAAVAGPWRGRPAYAQHGLLQHSTDIASSTRLFALPCCGPPAPHAAERQPRRAPTPGRFCAAGQGPARKASWCEVPLAGARATGSRPLLRVGHTSACREGSAKLSAFRKTSLQNRLQYDNRAIRA